MLDEIRGKTAALKGQIKALQAEAAALVKPMLQQFIADNPAIVRVRWTQYTPYFNDGEPCTFRVNDVYFFLQGDPEDGEGHSTPWPEWGSEHQIKYYANWDQKTYEAAKQFSKDMDGLENELLELFGDHCEVIVTAKGVDVEEYEHD